MRMSKNKARAKNISNHEHVIYIVLGPRKDG